MAKSPSSSKNSRNKNEKSEKKKKIKRGQTSRRSSSRKSVKDKKRSSSRSFWGTVVRISLILGIWGTAFGGLVLLWFSYDLPDTARLEQSTRRPGVTLLARDGTLLATYGDLYGKFTSASQLPPHVPEAIMAIEDRRFRSHFGIDVFGLFRAAYTNFKAGRVVQGGSTLTQQLAKSFLISEGLYAHHNRSLRRKVQELILAFWLERKFTKNQILTLYLNRVYLGAGVFGIEAASQKYFGKQAQDLSVLQAAIIAGLLKAPSKYSPTSNPKLSFERGKVVLKAMRDSDFINELEYQCALSQKNRLHAVKQKRAFGRYFADWVFEALSDYIGAVNQDLTVKTTFDPRLQRLAEAEAKKIMSSQGQKGGISQVALLAMTPSGAVRAMVGGAKYSQSQFNRVTQAKRQTGSIFKLFVFLCALEEGHTLQSQISDTPVRLGKWRPKNYGWRSRGALSLQDSFAYSVNTVTVRLAQKVRQQRIANLAHRMGLSSSLPKDLTLALGSGEATLLEMTAAFACLANHGFQVWPFGIEKIVETHSGKKIYQRRRQGDARVLAPQIVSDGLEMLQAVMRYGTGRKSALERPSAGKSGTSQNYRDAWFVGFTPDLVTGVWMGNDDGCYMKKVTGGKIPAKLWRSFMTKAHEKVPARSFPVLK